MIRAAELPIEVTSSSAHEAEARIALAAGFAGFAGHFPGDPVLPGMCHVDLALRVASRAFGERFDLVAVERARFARKALPGETLEVHVARRADRRLAVRHRVGGADCAEFVLEVSPRRADA